MEKGKTKQLSQTIVVEARGTYTRMRIKLPKGKGKVVSIKLHAIPRKQRIRSSAIYFGTANGTAHSTAPSTIDQAFADSLTRAEKNTKSVVLNLALSGGEKYYYARPKAWGLASFQIESSQGLVDGGFIAPRVLPISDAITGAIEAYYFYESINQDLTGTLYIL